MAVLSPEAYVTFNSNLPLYRTSTMQALFEPRTSIIVTLPIEKTKHSLLSAKEIVSWFRNEGLPIAAIAEIARVERKSVYAWINGGHVREPNQERLEKLHNLLSDKKQVELIHLYRFWNRQLMNDTSLGGLLCEERLNVQAIKAALSELWPMALRAKKSAMMHGGKNSGKSNPFLDEIGEVFISDDP